jgi:hypothetical protein
VKKPFICVAPVVPGVPAMVPMTQVACEACGRTCWLSLRNVALALFHSCFCVYCVRALLENEPMEAVHSEGSRADLRGLGLTDQQIDAGAVLMSEQILNGTWGKP